MIRNEDGNAIFKIILCLVSGAKVLPKIKINFLAVFVNSIFFISIRFVNFSIFAVIGA